MSQEKSEILKSLRQEIREQTYSHKAALSKRRSAFSRLSDQSTLVLTSAISIVATNTLLAPLERVKTICQTNSLSLTPRAAKVNTPLSVYTTICTDQGVINFFRGNMANWYKFTIQTFARAYIYQRFKLDPQERKSQGFTLIQNIATNSAISFAILAIAYPLDIAHTLMTSEMTKQGNSRTYSSVADWLRKVNTNPHMISSIGSDSRRVGNLYKGFSLAVASNLPYTALSLPMFDVFTSLTSQVSNGLEKDSFYTRALNRFLPPTLVMVLWSSALYPLETLRKLIQVSSTQGFQNKKVSAVKLAKTLGARGLYSGYTAHLVKIVPYTFIQFSLYQLAKSQIEM